MVSQAEWVTRERRDGLLPCRIGGHGCISFEILKFHWSVFAVLLLFSFREWDVVSFRCFDIRNMETSIERFFISMCSWCWGKGEYHIDLKQVTTNPTSYIPLAAFASFDSCYNATLGEWVFVFVAKGLWQVVLVSTSHRSVQCRQCHTSFGWCSCSWRAQNCACELLTRRHSMLSLTAEWLWGELYDWLLCQPHQCSIGLDLAAQFIVCLLY